jgi:hypothetical protein
MTNPLLRPDDRFRPKKIAEQAEANPFSEGDAVLEAEAAAAARNSNSFAPAGSGDTSRPYLPQYQTTAEHRAWLLLALDGISLFAGLMGVLVMWLGYLIPLLGIVPAVVAFFLAADDLRMMRLGGRNPDGRSLTILALVLGVVFPVAIGVMCGLFYYFEWSLFPDWL